MNTLIQLVKRLYGASMTACGSDHRCQCESAVLFHAILRALIGG